MKIKPKPYEYNNILPYNGDHNTEHLFGAIISILKALEIISKQLDELIFQTQK